MQLPKFSVLRKQDRAGAPTLRIAPYKHGYCPDCFNISIPDNECKHCKFKSGGNNPAHLLPIFTSLADGRYYVGRVLGNPGGFGVVYAGVQTSLSRAVAIKEFFPFENHLARRSAEGLGIVSEPDRIELFNYWQQQFFAEGLLLSRLRHPRIVAIYDFVEENGTYYIIMERLRGITLADYLGITQDKNKNTIFKQRLSQEDAMSLLCAALEALEAMHNDTPKPVMHLDISPGNLFLRGGNLDQLTLIDFGLAGNSTNTHASVPEIIVGNSAFMAPEQIDPERAPLSPATDCYSLAACLYAALAGTAPTAARERLRGVPITDISIWVPSLDATLAKTMMESLHIDPKKRPQDARAMRERLAAVSITLPAKSAPILIPHIEVVKQKPKGPQELAKQTANTQIEPKPVSTTDNMWFARLRYTALMLIFILLLCGILCLVWYEMLILGVITQILPTHILFPSPQPQNTTVEPISIPDPIPASVPDPIPVSVPDPIPVSVPDPIPVSVPDPIPVSVPDPIPDPTPDPTPVLIPVPKPEVQPDYIVNRHDGIVTDTKNGLIWKICSEGQEWQNNTCNKDAVSFTWDEIMPNNQQKTWDSYAGYEDWHVPTSNELLTLVRCSNGIATAIASRGASCSGKGWGVDVNSYHSPTIDTSIFTNTPKGTFWTASHYASISRAAWSVNFRSGIKSWEYSYVTRYVRLVRQR